MNHQIQQVNSIPVYVSHQRMAVLTTRVRSMLWMLLVVCLVTGLFLFPINTTTEQIEIATEQRIAAAHGETHQQPGISPVIQNLQQALSLIVQPDDSALPDVLDLYRLAMHNEGATAVQMLADAALALGNWGPAPGDTVIYDPSMVRNVRGQVWVADTLPVECGNPDLQSFNPWGDRFSHLCQSDLLQGENLIRLGRSAFLNLSSDGGTTPRPSFDDILATYIEEVGHSWQEYLFETEGLGSGPRTRITTWEQTIRLVPGREYQIKRYLLHLDSRLLVLSDFERAQLTSAICDLTGYANPLGYPFPTYGAPAGWPYPEGWLTTAPTREDVVDFCAEMDS